MENMYDKFDEKIMNGINGFVRAYNWTTGRTKKDLCLGLTAIGGVLQTSGFTTLPPSDILMGFGHYCMFDTNRKYMAKEEKIQNENIRYLDVEKKKAEAKSMTPLLIISSAIAFGYSMGIKNSYNDPIIKEQFASIGIGALADAAALYFFRADTLPPRKNCISRGLDQLKEWKSRNTPELATGLGSFASLAQTLS